ncbi:hypothetical protein LJC57_02375 [Parabacteroides sp. OttesenSCG-928-G07]|nr:hypothetical protein [Parabacteroides sp. OttesenSCG-928-G21]MDL2277415.1 hypothetical protein [Parabacteroides sp. OttesenSCG-928-G07]
MKTNTYILKILMAALAVFTLSCTKERELSGGDPNKNPSARYSFIISGGRSQIKGDLPDTRAHMDFNDSIYWWDPGDQVIMAITKVDEPTNIVEKFEYMKLLAMNKEIADSTTFLADLVQLEYENLMKAGTHFDFYSFFPDDIYGVSPTSSPTNLQFTMRGDYTLAPNTFVEDIYAPMVGVVRNEEPEIFFPEDDVDPMYQLGGLHFNYEHILSYAAIEMDVKLIPENVTAIKMTVGEGLNDATRINGTMSYNSYTGTYTLTGGSNSVTVNITNGGLAPGSGQVVYIPMPVKDLSNQKLTFEFTTAGSGTYAYKTLTTSAFSGVNFERGKIHRIRVAPGAQYTANTSFTIPKSGYYYIEAWGGDGGRGGRSYQNDTQSPGGIAQKISGLYYLNEGTSFSLYIGSAGVSKPAGRAEGSGAGAAGGTNGFAYGAGGSGGQGHQHDLYSSQYSGAGGGGGAGTFVFAGGTSLPANLLIVSGGGGGSGGGSSNSSSTYSTGGTGGTGGTGATSGDGGRATNSGGQGATTFNSSPTGGNGTNGDGGSILNAPGGGGGGGGGGYQFGGNGGTGGQSGWNNSSKGGGGGKGGQSYVAAQATLPSGYTLPTNTTRPSTDDGCVVITFYRKKAD